MGNQVVRLNEMHLALSAWPLVFISNMIVLNYFWIQEMISLLGKIAVLCYLD